MVYTLIKALGYGAVITSHKNSLCKRNQNLSLLNESRLLSFSLYVRFYEIAVAYKQILCLHTKLHYRNRIDFYMFNNVEIHQKNKGAKLEPTKKDFEEIKELVNRREFETRKILKQGSYKEPAFENNNVECDCHATATKFTEINDGWEKVSGYLIEKARFDKENVIRLTAHSVVRDDKNNLFELMECVYPLEKYYFILHNSGSQGFDLKATK